MENITNLFKETYLPKKALVIYGAEHEKEQVYVEAYDINRAGKPINAHPLTMRETSALAECLTISAELGNQYLKTKGLLPEKVLYINPSSNGFAVWYTPEQEVGLLFTSSLGIPSGKAFVPPLVWKADKRTLTLHAVKNKIKPTIKAPLQCAPFFNLHGDSTVCMGTVDIDMENIDCLEAFMAHWEQLYWNSYFSHMLGGVSPVAGNIVQLWQRLVNTGNKFPLDVLKADGKTIKDLIV